MKIEEKSCGCIIFDENKNVLLIKENIGDWGFPKGHVEHDETEEDTAKREVKEETNLDVENIIDMNWNFQYESLGKKCNEHAFISKVKENKILLNEESIQYEWLTLEDFINKIDWFYDKKELKEKLSIELL